MRFLAQMGFVVGFIGGGHRQIISRKDFDILRADHITGFYTHVMLRPDIYAVPTQRGAKSLTVMDFIVGLNTALRQQATTALFAVLHQVRGGVAGSEPDIPSRLHRQCATGYNLRRPGSDIPSGIKRNRARGSYTGTDVCLLS